MRLCPSAYCNFSSASAKNPQDSTLRHEASSAIIVNHWFLMSRCYIEVLGVPLILWTGWMWRGLPPVKRERKGQEGREKPGWSVWRDYHRQVWTAVRTLAKQPWPWHDCTNMYNIWLLPNFLLYINTGGESHPFAQTAKNQLPQNSPCVSRCQSRNMPLIKKINKKKRKEVWMLQHNKVNSWNMFCVKGVHWLEGKRKDRRVLSRSGLWSVWHQLCG